MAKAKKGEEQMPEVQPVLKKIDTVTLADWANGNSWGRVELMAAFVHTEQVAGRLRDSSANYQRRFEDFANKPTR